MTTSHDRAFEIFAAICELDGSAREQELAALDQTDTTLANDVRSLLAFDQGDDETGETAGAALLLDATLNLAGQMVGPYRISDLIGRGGAGSVYRARQQHPERDVALKVLTQDLPSESMRRRFELEAELLAQLDHPGIAHVYASGSFELADSRQRPWFAMELIEGRRLDVWAKEDSPSITQRLALLRELCEALEHAHLKGIVHRDLKPANILVDAHGKPRVLDFGIAHLSESALAPETFITEEGLVLGTLPYMSPEQASGRSAELDRRSDVYALGVVGYELLSGRLPHELDACSFPEALQRIAQGASRRLGTEDHRFRGDLETIFAKALSQEPERRYASASAFAEDLTRFERDEAVLARPPSTAYQLSKLARRHRGLVAGIVLAILGLVLGTAFALRFAFDAQRSAEREAEAAADARLQARRASERESESRRAQQAEARARRLAEQQGASLIRIFSNAAPGSIGGRRPDFLEAIRAEADAIAALGDEHRELIESLLPILGGALVDYGDIDRVEGIVDALEARSGSPLEKSAPLLQLQLLGLRSRLAANDGRVEEALVHADELVQLLDEHRGEDRFDEDHLRTLIWRARLIGRQDRVPEALALAAEARGVAKDLGQPKLLAHAHVAEAELALRAGQAPRFAVALTEARKLLPNEPEPELMIARLLFLEGHLAAQRQGAEAALKKLRASIDMTRLLLGPQSAELIDPMLFESRLLSGLGRITEGSRLLDAAEAIPTSTVMQSLEIQVGRAFLAQRARRWEEALEAVDEARRRADSIDEIPPHLDQLLAGIAVEAHLADDDWEAALPKLVRLRQIAEKAARGTPSPPLMNALCDEARALLFLDETDAALHCARRALELAKRSGKADEDAVHNSWTQSLRMTDYEGELEALDENE